MKILVLQGSPNTKGSTALLVSEFTRGAKEAGHNVEVVDVANLDIAPCTGCVVCGYEGPCAQSDDMDTLRAKILASDMLVFATPLYYYGSRITGKHLKSALLTVAWNANDWTFDALEAHYNTLVRYLSLRDCGRVLGYGCGTTGMTKRSQFPGEAYRLGKSLS